MSFLAFALVIISQQKKLMQGMGSTIQQSLEKSNATMADIFSRLDTEIEQRMSYMGDSTSELLGASTRDSLLAEKEHIQRAWNATVEKNGDGSATLLAQVAPTAILSNDFTALINYAKAATANPDIVYALYLRPNGKPYTRYLDKDNPKIQEYFNTGSGKKKYQRVISASEQDNSVLVLKKPINFQGKELGTILLCISRSAVTEQVNEMEQRFFELIATTGEISENLSQASGGINEVNENVAQSSTVAMEIANEIAAVNQVAADIDSNSSQVNSSSGDLSNLAVTLKALLNEFKVAGGSTTSTALAGSTVAGEKNEIAPLVAWNHNLSIEIKQIDEEYKKLIELINLLHEKLTIGQGREALEIILNELLDYTIYHFEAEEKLMKIHGYDQLDEHKVIHENLVNKVSDFRRQFMEDKASVDVELMSF